MEIKEIELPEELFNAVKEIAQREKFPKCLDILSKYRNGKLSLNQEQAQHLSDVLGYEANRVSLKYPYNDEHQNYMEEDADKWGDFCQSILPHTMDCMTRYFDIEE